MKNAIKKKNLKMKEVVGNEIATNPKIATLTGILLFTILISLGGSIWRHNWALMILTLVVGILISLPMFVEKWSKISIPDKLKVYIILFFYATLFLGELQNYYDKYWWWDMLLHTSSGLAFGVVGFLILYVLYKTEKIKASPKIAAMFSFCFSLAIGALWEIVEFTLDISFGQVSNGGYMQTVVNGCGLADTMKDLIVDALGALFASVMGYFYLRRDSGVVVKPMMKEFKKDNPRLFKKK